MTAPTPRDVLATSLRATYDAGGEGWRLVLMSEDGGIAPNDLPDEFIDVVYAALTRQPDSGALDVERLADMFSRWLLEQDFRGFHNWRAFAEDFAAEYARLAEDAEG